jgi:hypothetical protein
MICNRRDFEQGYKSGAGEVSSRTKHDKNIIINEFIAAPDAATTLEYVLTHLHDTDVGPKWVVYGSELFVLPPEYDDEPQRDGNQRRGD